MPCVERCAVSHGVPWWSTSQPRLPFKGKRRSWARNMHPPHPSLSEHLTLNLTRKSRGWTHKQAPPHSSSEPKGRRLLRRNRQEEREARGTWAHYPRAPRQPGAWARNTRTLRLRTHETAVPRHSWPSLAPPRHAARRPASSASLMVFSFSECATSLLPALGVASSPRLLETVGSNSSRNGRLETVGSKRSA